MKGKNTVGDKVSGGGEAGKMETSRIRLETKTVQILLWPGRRPSFHFNHFEFSSSAPHVHIVLSMKPKGH